MIGEPLQVLVCNGLEHDVPPRGHADLALMQERAPGPRGGGDVEVGVVEHDEGVVAAQLQRDPLEGTAGRRAHLTADGRRAGERDHRDVRVERERGTSLGIAGKHVQQAGRKPGLLEQPRDQDAPGHGRVNVGLQDDRVAEGERGRHRAHREDLREVPRADDTHHAERQPLGDGLAARLGGGEQVAPGLRRQRCRLPQFTEHEADLERGLAGNRAALADQPGLELCPVVLQDPGDVPDQCRPLVPGGGGPRGLRGPGLLGGRGDVVLASQPDLGQRLPGGRLDAGQRPAAARGSSCR